MSSHPGSHLKEAIALAEYIRDLGYMPEQVQDFYPTPGTISTCMYYTGLDPRTMQKVYVPVTLKEKQMQRALIQYRNPENYDMVKEALIKGGREDLIGFDEHCLIPPRKMGKNYHPVQKHSEKSSKKMDVGKGNRKKHIQSGTGKHKTDTFQSGKQKTQERGKTKKTIRNVHKKKKRG